MSVLLQISNIVVAAISLFAGLVALLFIPDAWAQRTAEPEDLLVLAAWAGVMAVFAATALLSYRELKRLYRANRRGIGVAVMNFVSAALCMVGIVLGATSGQPSSVDMYLLAIPGILFVLNGLTLVRT